MVRSARMRSVLIAIGHRCRLSSYGGVSSKCGIFRFGKRIPGYRSPTPREIFLGSCGFISLVHTSIPGGFIAES